jgi:hypothetical protein
MERYGAIPTKGYVVVEVGWEYDDEFYYRGECDGGNPRKIYLSYVAGKAEVDRLNSERRSQKYQDRMITSEYDEEIGEHKTIQDYYELIEVEVIDA